MAEVRGAAHSVMKRKFRDPKENSSMAPTLTRVDIFMKMCSSYKHTYEHIKEI